MRDTGRVLPGRQNEEPAVAGLDLSLLPHTPPDDLQQEPEIRRRISSLGHDALRLGHGWVLERVVLSDHRPRLCYD